MPSLLSSTSLEVEALRLTVQGLIISDMAAVLLVLVLVVAVLVMVLGSFSGFALVQLGVAVVFLSSSECRVNQAFFSLW